MKIPFSPPYIDESVKKEVLDSLDSGWITTGPKVSLLEREIAGYTGCEHVLCINSWTSGALLMLKWFDLQPGDEVIVPAYTYAATALSVLHAGGTPVLVDIGDDFNISLKAIEAAITPRTKVIMPVDIGGWPCDYQQINDLVQRKKGLFVPFGENQQKLGRILVISDAAHSIGSIFQNKAAGTLTDITIFSLHAVKNITTAEGGAICLNLEGFDNGELYRLLRCYALNGQTKDALAKSQIGAWRYDIIYPGLKINMPDVLAAIGLAQIRQYKEDLLPSRKRIFHFYNDYFSRQEWAITPPFADQERESSCHIYLLRIRGADEKQRDKIIEKISEQGVAVNVHFQPLPLLTLFRDLGYSISDYPMAFAMYQNEISLPIYPQLEEAQLEYILSSVTKAVESVFAKTNL
jgi:dTDP-4-amino-4,6-dideoxygalactose transaminase